MATTKHAISEHDVVVLRTAVGAWPAGTTGAVISAYDDTLLVEIAGRAARRSTRSRSPLPSSTSSTPDPGALDRQLARGPLVQALITRSA